MDKFKNEYFVWKDSMLLQDDKYAAKLVVPEDSRTLYRELHTELVSCYYEYCMRDGVPAQTTKQDSSLTLSPRVPPEMWRQMVGADESPDTVTIDYLDRLHDLRDVRFIYENVRHAVQKQGFVQCDNFYYEMNPEHPLWMIPISLPWARRKTMPALARHNHMTYYTTKSLERLQLLLRWAHFHSVSPSSASFCPMVFSLQNDHDSHRHRGFEGWKYFLPMHKIFVMWHTDVNWSVWVGVKRRDAEQYEDKIVVPKYALLAELVGELRQAHDGDQYQCEVSSSKDIVMTCYAPNMPLVGGAGFLVNMSCDREQRLCDKIESNGLRKHQTWYLEVQGVDTEQSSQHQGPFLHCPLNRDLTGASFLHSPMTPRSVTLQGEEYVLLPVEISYFNDEKLPEGGETIPCGCLTRCARKPLDERSRIQTLGDVQGRPKQKGRKADEFDLNFQ